jgi:two-component system CheB/CheR fusion protein
MKTTTAIISKSKKPAIKRSIKKDSFTVVAIGASAGGLEAITLFLKNISSTTGMAFIFVQHLSPDHKSLLVPLLSKNTKMNVQEVEDMEKMEPNNVYIIPYNKEIVVVDGHIKLIPRPKNKLANLSIDVLFSSLALTHKKNVIGIILSGNGSDGTIGLKEIKLAGGLTFAQDASAKSSSMPNSAIKEGVVDFVLSPKEMAIEIISLSKNFLAKSIFKTSAPEDEIENNDPHLKNILQLIHKRKNVDFSHYKMNTVKRRILRRMLIHKTKKIKLYVDLLTKKNDEVDLLYEDLLINVTEFFRDTDAFMLLKKTVLTKLLKRKVAGETLRIWVAACATGEEVYSVAMTLIELQDSKINNIPFQIFASDLSAEAIRIARNGEYTIHQLKNVSPKRLLRFFTKVKDKYRISQSLRDVCVFAQHNILSDPPFSRMDFISCRNFLIYLETDAQRKAIATFHYALNEAGCLMLGKAETIGTSTQLFTPLNKTYKIYSRKNHSGTHKIPELIPRISHTILKPQNNSVRVLPKKMPLQAGINLGNSFDALLLAQYIPASVIINYDMEILQFRGNTTLYLKQSSGKASFNILKMVNAEITFELRNAIHHAIKTKQTINKAGIEMDRDVSENTLHVVNIEVSPLKLEGEEPLLLVVFTGKTVELIEQPLKGIKSNSIGKDKRIKKLEEEIASARYDMGSITHDQEAVNEELQSANEEIVSSNEELQSLNEELETSKEEIESTNEELVTTNQELTTRIQQVEELYTYYEGILSTIHEPMLILDKNMRVKSANASFCKMFKVSEDESVGITLYKLGDNQWNIPRLRELLEDIVPKNKHFHDFEVEHTFPIVGHKIMLLNAHRITQQRTNEELIVLTMTDATAVRTLSLALKEKERKVLEVQLEAEKKASKIIEDSEKRYSMMLMQSPFTFVVLKGKNKVITIANDRIKQVWGKGNDIEGKYLLDLMPELKNTAFPALLDKVCKTGIPYHGSEVQSPNHLDGSMKDEYFNFVFQPYLEVDGTISGVTIIGYEVTEQVNVKKALETKREAEKIASKVIEETNKELTEAKNDAELKTKIAEDAVQSKQRFLSNMSHEIRTPLNAIIGFTNVMLKTDVSAKQKEFLQAIKTSGEALTVLINDILDLAKVDAGKMTFEKRVFKMEESISAMLHLFELKIQEKNIEFIKEYDKKIPSVLVGDPVRLHQIILNLVSNAEKFTTKGKITVSVNLIKEDEEKVTIEFIVSDTGIGIPEDKISNVFENFEQASTGTSRLYGGTGLGLAIVKQLVEPQGGSIHVKSKIGLGSTFSFILNFDKTNAELESEVDHIESNSEIKNISVLVVEDVALNQLLIKTLLDDFGFKYDSASNGKLAIEKLETNTYDIILMDLQMPEMNGFEATEYIRNTMNSKIPIIALTADVTTVDFSKCKAFGMDDYISKPVDDKELFSKIVSLVKVRSSIEYNDTKTNEVNLSRNSKYTDLVYLTHRTKSNPKLMLDMISIYLEQTPPLISVMKQSLQDKDWNTLQSVVHKMIPSFSIMGISKDFENIAKRVQEDADNIQRQANAIPNMVLQLETICKEACKELEEEFINIKNTNK